MISHSAGLPTQFLMKVVVQVYVSALGYASGFGGKNNLQAAEMFNGTATPILFPPACPNIPGQVTVPRVVMGTEAIL